MVIKMELASFDTWKPRNESNSFRPGPISYLIYVLLLIPIGNQKQRDARSCLRNHMPWDNASYADGARADTLYGESTMLILARKRFESVIIGQDIRITVLALSGGKVRIGIEAPDRLGIVRYELMSSTSGPSPLLELFKAESHTRPKWTD
jgi:carbon storage regulator